jgi:hypothetical protein
MLCLLVRREYFSASRGLPLEGPVASEVQDHVGWMGIYAQGQKIGFANTQVYRDGDGFRVEEKALLRLNLLGVPRDVRNLMVIRTDERFALKSFHMSLESGPTRFEMMGDLVPTGLSLEIRSGGKGRRQEIPLAEVPWLAQTLRFFLLQRPLAVGLRFQLPLFDPLTLSIQPLEVVVEARESHRWEDKILPVFRLVYSWMGLQSRAWVTETGEVMREEGWGGFSLVRESQEDALVKNWPAGRGVDLMRASAVSVETPLPSPRELSSLKIRFSKVDVGRFALQGPRQRVRGQEVEVVREDLATAAGFSLPHPGGAGYESSLDPSPMIESDDPEIRSQARRILEGEGDALRAVWRLLQWVHENLEKIPTVSVPSALEVLRTRQGDCNEHAVLFAALGRAAGIPTKLVAGLVYQDGRFYYHAWNEVFLGNWFSVDPLMGQFPADATHIRFVEGGLERQAQLIPLIGTLKAEIVSHR